MTKRRSRGDGGLFWDERRQRWIASVTVGYDGRASECSAGQAAGPRLKQRTSSRKSSELMTMKW
jgi:hypothetical protein